MIERLIVHIGQHKTGTTALQQALHRSAPALAAAGVCYPAPPGADRTDHRDVAFELGISWRRLSPGPAWSAFLGAAKASGCPTVILSSETLMIMGPRKITRAVDFLSEHAKRVDALVYVRHPVHFANSAVSTQLRVGSTLDAFIADPKLDNVRDVIRRWRGVLARIDKGGKVLVRSYDRDVDPTWSILDDAMETMGFGALGPQLYRAPSPPNSGLSALGVYLLDWINRQPRAEPLAHGSLSPFGSIDGPAYVLPDPAREMIRENNKQLLYFLKNQFGVELREREESATPPCPLTEAELSSLATLLLASTQFGFEVHRSRPGRWFGFDPPYFSRRSNRPPRKGILPNRLLAPLLGPHGLRANATGELTQPDGDGQPGPPERPRRNRP